MKRDCDPKKLQEEVTEKKTSLLLGLLKRSFQGRNVPDKEDTNVEDLPEELAQSSASVMQKATEVHPEEETPVADALPLEDDGESSSADVPEIEAETATIGSEEASEADSEKKPEEERITLQVTDDRMEASITVASPKEDEEGIKSEQIKEFLEGKGIVSGVNRNMLPLIQKLKMYDKPLVIAKGVYPQNGKDGEIIDHFPREQKIRLVESESGQVDFKNLNIVTNVAKGTVICDIVPPEPPIDGNNIYGEVVPGKAGTAAKPPAGKNMEINETQMLAACDGNLVFSDNKFRVDDILKIEGNVDNQVGNIDFCGSVIIMGDVCEGFSVDSKKNVEIHGNVEGASVTAKGDIVIKKGMNGMQKGILRAGNDIHCKFFESCSANANGSIYVESAINSTIQAEDKLVVSGKRGVISGGNYTARNLVQAMKVGSHAHVATTVTVGISPEMLQLYGKLSKELRTLQQDLDALQKDIAYLEERERNNSLGTKQKEQLVDKRKQKTVNLMQTSTLSKQVKTIEESMEDAKSGRLVCNQIYPPTQIRMGSEILTIKVQESNCLFHLVDGKIQKDLKI